ncbi:NFACT RNA binding domain-containing protein [Desulfolutivibrio sp.]|uniref:NFACT RNA binding domain-containing protein n=1 Tax=Desulfolutivibrio sp. TaxID=2773296 RepID=UPI002F963FD9
MEADFFRSLLPLLARTLTGVRLRKIAFPAPGLFSLGLSGACTPDETDAPPPKYLHGRTGPGRFFLFVSAHKPTFPPEPPAKAMWLRKRLSDRRILGALGDWPSRRLALCLSQGEGRFFVIDAKSGLSLTDTLPDGFGGQPDWPDFEAVRGDPDIWQRHAHITPRLRKAVAMLPQEQARDFYAAVQRGEAEGFFVALPGPAAALAPGAPPALPLDVFCRPMPGLSPQVILTAFPDPLSAAAAFGEPHFFAAASGDTAQKAVVSEKNRARRTARAVSRLEQDEARLTAMIGQGAFAEAIAANLHRLDGKSRIPSLTLEHPEKGTMTQGLDPRLTVLENMTHLFSRAAKGRRGLAVVAARRTALADPKQSGDPVAGWPGRPSASDGPAPGGKPAAKQARDRAAKPTVPADDLEPGRFRGIPAHIYRTSDGFLALRGKNARANEELLRKAASPFDYWFHVEGGPGAHVILRRDHPGREVPRQSLIEAATLAALASWRAGDAKALVLMALVRDVRRGKGFAPGQVQVEKLAETLAVNLDPELEKTLRLP